MFQVRFFMFALWLLQGALLADIHEFVGALPNGVIVSGACGDDQLPYAAEISIGRNLYDVTVPEQPHTGAVMRAAIHPHEFPEIDDGSTALANVVQACVLLGMRLECSVRLPLHILHVPGRAHAALPSCKELLHVFRSRGITCDAICAGDEPGEVVLVWNRRSCSEYAQEHVLVQWLVARGALTDEYICSWVGPKKENARAGMLTFDLYACDYLLGTDMLSDQSEHAHGPSAFARYMISGIVRYMPEIFILLCRNISRLGPLHKQYPIMWGIETDTLIAWRHPREQFGHVGSAVRIECIDPRVNIWYAYAAIIYAALLGVRHRMTIGDTVFYRHHNSNQLHMGSDQMHILPSSIDQLCFLSQESDIMLHFFGRYLHALQSLLRAA